jgi:hypothetical protein
VTPERALAEDCVRAVGQILSNYQAALQTLEQSGGAATGSASAVFAPVRDACAGVAPGLDAVVAEAAAATPGEERQSVAATHSRLLRRQSGLVETAARGDRAALAATAARLRKLAAGSHSAGALFTALLSSEPPGSRDPGTA